MAAAVLLSVFCRSMLLVAAVVWVAVLPAIALLVVFDDGLADELDADDCDDNAVDDVVGTLAADVAAAAASIG